MSATTVRELTPTGRGAVRVLEVRGTQAWEHVRDRLGLGVRPAPFAVARLRAGDEVLDEALVVVPEAGCVELHLHGSPAVVRRVLEVLELPAGPEVPGWSVARAGEAALEALADEALAQAPSEACARMLLDQREGALRRALEAYLGDEGAAPTGLLEQARIARHLLRPPLILLVGVTNAGKSTLLNALLDRERALVDGRAGTTRDAIRERVQLGAWAVDLVDTAGERGAEDDVEAAGQALASELRREADLVIRLVPWRPDVGRPLPRLPGEIALLSQVDRAGRSPGPAELTARADPAGARGVIEETLRAALDLPGEPWSPGAGVPFLPGLAADLGLAAPESRRRVRAWLAGPRRR
jgi:tRNA modification GTPase